MKRTMVVIGKKKLIFTALLLIGVVVPLMVASYSVQVENVSAPVSKMLPYESEKEGLKFNYPQGWLLRIEKDYSGGEIIENISFSGPDQGAHGFVQVMKLGMPVTDYIARAKKTMVPGYDSYNFKKLKSPEKPGYVLSYRRGQGNGRLAAIEYFYEGNNKKVYRFSCFYPQKLAGQYEEIFSQMLTSMTFPVEEPEPRTGSDNNAKNASE